MKFGERLRKLRHERGLTQNELASRAGLQGQTIWRYECAGMEPRRPTLVRLAAALGIEVEDLAGSHTYTDTTSPAGAQG